MPAVLSVDLARTSADIGLCLLRHDKATCWMASFIPAADWGMPNSPSPATLANAIFDFCLREYVSIVLLDGPQGWKDPESPLSHWRQCEKALNTPAKTGVQGVVKPGTYTAFVEFSIAVFAHLLERGAKLASTPEVKIEPGLLALECFPNAAWRKLGINPLPAKARYKPADISNRLTELRGRFEIETPNNSPTHDELQALVSAFAGKAILEEHPQAYCAHGVSPSFKNGTIVEGFIVGPIAVARGTRESGHE